MKFSCVYIEKEVLGSARVQEILSLVPDLPRITIDRYGEVFNRKSQNFRLQKQNPALILARKHGKLVLPVPQGYGYNNDPAFYFSHMLNCIYDCRYCFLQGMYRSANYVLFVNYEDFATEMEGHVNKAEMNTVFYSGYDCDSLALEPISNFCDYFIEWFSRHSNSILEIRTKSTQVRRLLNRTPIKNCIIAMSFTPEEVSRRWESKVPQIVKRLDALKKLQLKGWTIALRFEPLIYSTNFAVDYEKLLALIFSELDASKIHSVSTGMFRMPKTYFKNVAELYPDEPLYARKFENRDGYVSQPIELEQEMRAKVDDLLLRHVQSNQTYICD